MSSTTFLPTQKPKKTTIDTILLDTTYLQKNNKMLSEKVPTEELDENDQKMTPENGRNIPVLCKINIPHNVNGTKITGGGTDKTNNRNRKLDNSLLKL